MVAASRPVRRTLGTIVSVRRVFLGALAIVFAASAAMTIANSISMSAMGEMEMPGGWTMSHMWMWMPGQSWLNATAAFVAMWLIMMVAMMLPSLTPTLLRYHDSLGRAGVRQAGLLTAIMAAGYFIVWGALGAVIFPIGVTVAGVAMREPALSAAVPTLAVAVALVGGLIEVKAWIHPWCPDGTLSTRIARIPRLTARDDKVAAPDDKVAARDDKVGAWREGLRLGLHCCQSCAGLTLVMLSLGIMDVRVMAVMTAAVTARRYVRDRDALVLPSNAANRRVWWPGLYP